MLDNNTVRSIVHENIIKLLDRDLEICSCIFTETM
jgi:hypothetical protein